MIKKINFSLRLKLIIHLLMIMNLNYADNAELFNQARSVGNQNQFKLNLNQNSSIDSYGATNKFTSDVANSANEGNANSKNMYNGASNDPNYLYNNGTQAIRDCEKRSDPRCTTLNKYGDKDTQTQIQAYTQGLSTRYLMSITPDPVDQSCSIIKRKSPINQSTATCISSTKQQDQCFNTITPSFSMRCSSTQAISDRRWRQADPTGHCDYIDVKLSCDTGGSYMVLLASEDCSHSGYSSTATTTFTPTIQQQSGILNLTPTWSGGGDGCGGGGIVNLKFNYFCPVNGDCVIDFNASCGNRQSIYSNTFNFSSLTTKQYNYQYTKGCVNAN
ncbi:MAG: hypothetical protein K2P99_03300 [Burkholderiales bacterium]|nr:hypothetical protein [Burkholderiales bacterium]